jgi:hypothetical protein
VSTNQPPQPPFPGSAPGQSLTQILELWEPFVHQALEAQTAAFESWVDGLAATPNVPEPLKAQLLQMHELSRGWTESQWRMWDTMFEILHQLTSNTQQPTAMSLMPGLDMWQKMAAPMFAAQAAWMRQSADLIGGANRGERKTKT